MSDNQTFNKLYREVSENMAVAMADVSKLTVSNSEGQGKLDNITKTLEKMQAGFEAELEFLEANAEWEKFTMAFFGETNAGKSTIIESLRILFNESSRQQLIEENRQDLDELGRKLQTHANHAETALAEEFHKHAKDVEDVRKECGEFKAILEDESAQRLRIAQEAASSRVKRNLVFACLVGVLAGAGGASALILALGG